MESPGTAPNIPSASARASFACNANDRSRDVGLSFVHAPGDKHVTDVVADKTKTSDLKIRNLGNGRFEVTDRHGKHQPTEGLPIIATDIYQGRVNCLSRLTRPTAAAPPSAR
jgi:hypothetical protein